MRSEAAAFRLVPVSFADLPGWSAEDPRPLLPAMADCLHHITTVKPYRTGSLGLTVEDLRPLLESALLVPAHDASSLRQFFEAQCQPFLIRRDDGAPGFVTAFYEPEIAVRDRPDPEYRYPFYRRPDDLVDLDDGNRPPELEPDRLFGLLDKGKITAYPDRQAIDQGWLEGRGLEIAWARSKVDVFFVHVQGAARLVFEDGRIGRITYAAKAGHPFSGIGKLLMDRGEIPLSAMSMQAIRQWLADHPDEVDEVLWHNRSYIFFREAPVTDPTRGPVAAAKVPLVAGRSLAVDRTIHTFGFPVYLHAEHLEQLNGGEPFSRLMLALETGSAIIGPARGDIFTGSGDEAGALAGAVRHAADFYLLVPKSAAARFL